jgi:hypothetical protein
MRKRLRQTLLSEIWRHPYADCSEFAGRRRTLQVDEKIEGYGLFKSRNEDSCHHRRNKPYSKSVAAWVAFLGHEGTNERVSSNDATDDGLDRSFCLVQCAKYVSLGRFRQTIEKQKWNLGSCKAFNDTASAIPRDEQHETKLLIHQLRETI